MALDPRIKQALNDFHKTQPALNLSDLPYGQRGILLGDILDEIIANVAKVAQKLDLELSLTANDYEAESTGNDSQTTELG